MSGPLHGGPSGPLYGGTADQPSGGEQGQVSGSRWSGTTAGGARELRSLVPQLVRAFSQFDTFVADRLVDEALSARSVEMVCIGLLQPALVRVGEHWAQRQLGIPEEHFATEFVRGRLHAIYAGQPERFDGPLAVVTCGPRETHDLGALMLAVFWRRAGLRVIFLGQDMDGEALVASVRAQQPQVVCVSIATPQRVRSLARIARAVAQMGPPRPIFTYGGGAFTRHPELQRKVIGIYLGDDAVTATWHITRLLGLDRAGGNPTVPPGGSLGQAG
jgi:methanogenic corrinoid protein MtbC1